MKLTRQNIDNELKSIFNKLNKQLEQEVVSLNEKIIEMTPVDTGFLRSAFNPVSNNNNRFKISNNTQYAYSVLILGRRTENGKPEGSAQLPEGILPTIRQWKKTLEKRS